MTKLSQSTIEKLKYYVYILNDPRSGRPFYVGKGRGSRINQHELEALEANSDEVGKIKKIHEIRKAGEKVEYVIARSGLKTSAQAFEVECALIDYIGMSNLTNIVSGHNSAECGLMSLEEYEIMYQAEEAIFNEPVLLININHLYSKSKDVDLYEITRKYWKVNIGRANKIKIVCATYLGIIREVFEVEEWKLSRRDDKRAYFVGTKAKKSIRDKYINKSVKNYCKRGSQNPIKYVENGKKENNSMKELKFMVKPQKDETAEEMAHRLFLLMQEAMVKSNPKDKKKLEKKLNEQKK